MEKNTHSTNREPGGIVAAETQSPPPQPLIVWTVEDLATYLKVEKSTVYERLRFRSAQDPRPMPAHKMVGYWRFFKHEIDVWLLSLPRTVPERKRKYVRREKAA